MAEDTNNQTTDNQSGGGGFGGDSENVNLGPFNRLLDIEGVDGPQDIFGNVGIPGENPFGGGDSEGGGSPMGGGGEGGAPSDMGGELAYGGNPFAGDNFWTIFNGGVNPADAASGGSPMGGGDSEGGNPFGGGFGGGSPMSGGFGGDDMGDGSGAPDFDFGSVFGMSSDSGLSMDFLEGIEEVVGSGDLPFDKSEDLLSFLGLDASDFGGNMSLPTENNSFEG